MHPIVVDALVGVAVASLAVATTLSYLGDECAVEEKGLDRKWAVGA